MTNMILGIIGIVLAAASTLIVINYGGDYYADAYNDGDAMNVENGLSNLYTAYNLHEMKTGAVPGSVSDMLEGSGSGTLDELPILRGGAELDESWQTISVDGVSKKVAMIHAVPQDVCLAMNMRAGRNVVPDAATGPIGCFDRGSEMAAYKTL